jgi:hypothetical protein
MTPERKPRRRARRVRKPTGGRYLTFFVCGALTLAGIAERSMVSTLLGLALMLVALIDFRPGQGR